MKSFIAPALLAIASLTSAATIPLNDNQEVVWTDDDEVVSQQTAAGKYCIHIRSPLTWYYQFDGRIWGSGKGQGPKARGNVCVPTNNGAGGAMFIGPNPSPSGGSTKFECKFPTSGTANCDVSLVDGYSLSMECKAGGQPKIIGGGIDLYKTGKHCPDQQGANCINTVGAHAGSQGAVNAFFQPAVSNGNNYCIWHSCVQDYSFSVTAGLDCTVSGGK